MEDLLTGIYTKIKSGLKFAYDQVNTDAGGRIRVSQLTTLLDGKVVNGHTGLIFEEAGTGSHSVGNSKNEMTVAAGEWTVFQSKRFYPYFAGKSQVCECTFDNFQPETGVTKRFGYFSSNAVSPFDTTYDGIWCENNGSSISLNIARAGTSTMNVDIADWSGYNDLAEYKDLANWENFTVCIIDLLWLGGAVMRFWIKTSNGFVLAHQFNYSGTDTDVFIQYPCQPLRYEMRSSTGAGTFRYICSQIATEGSFDEDGIVRAIDTGTAPISMAAAGTTYPLIALKKQSAYRCVASRIVDYDVFVTSANDRLQWTIQVNPTLSAPLSYSPVASSSIESAVGDGSITVSTPGTIMASGHISTNGTLPKGVLVGNFLAYMGGTLANAMDEYVLCVSPLTGSSNVNTFGTLSYKEY